MSSPTKMLPSSAQLAPAKQPSMSPSGTTVPPSTEILLTLPFGAEANPLPVGREERMGRSLRSRKLGGLSVDRGGG